MWKNFAISLKLITIVQHTEVQLLKPWLDSIYVWNDSQKNFQL